MPDKPFTATQCEGYSDSVARLYTAGLGREPEQGGFDFWINEYTFGNWTFSGMANFFVNSPEFQESYGALTQDEFIRQLYRNVLGREGETGGITFWNDQMTAGMTRATVLMRFAESPENITNSGTVEPILGPFNEGRPEGAWRCGPSLADSLFQLDDFPTGWIQSSGTAPAEPLTGCEAAFDFQANTQESVQFAAGDNQGPLIAQGLFVYPTPYGAQQYLAQTRQAIIDCAFYRNRAGTNVAITEISTAGFGDDSVAYRLTYELSTGFTFDVIRIVIHDGLVVSGVGHLDLAFTDPSFTAQWAALAAERIAALPFNQ